MTFFFYLILLSTIEERFFFSKLGLVFTTKSQVSFYAAARIPEICAINNIAQRLKSELRSNLKVRLRCTYRPRFPHILEV